MLYASLSYLILFYQINLVHVHKFQEKEIISQTRQLIYVHNKVALPPPPPPPPGPNTELISD